MNANLNKTITSLKKKRHVLFITTSNRWIGDEEDTKSTLLAKRIQTMLGEDKITLLDATRLKIHPCEGNVSRRKGNNCGAKGAVLKDSRKNPSGLHRCWANINNKDDKLWRVSRALLRSDAVVFFGSVRWGQMNSIYQKVIERLTWLENRHSTFGEANVLAGISAGLICTGHNWNEEHVIATQKQVLKFFGFNVPTALSWFWRYTRDSGDESRQSYRDAFKVFAEEFDIETS
jgi:multimeric flavodoxin WrbA